MKTFECIFVCILAALVAFGCMPGEEKPATKGPVTNPMANKTAASGEIVLQVNAGNVDNLLKPIQQCSLQVDSDKIKILSTGTDPFLEIETLNLDKQGQYVIKMVLSAPDNTVSQIFFGRKETPYSEKDSKMVEVFKGVNKICMDITEPQTIRTLRLDPGSLAGEYQLIEFVVERLQ